MVFMVWFGLDISIASMIYYDAIWNSCCNSQIHRYRCQIGVACLHTCRVSVSTNEDEGAGGRIDGSLLQPRTLYSLRTGNNNNLIGSYNNINNNPKLNNYYYTIQKIQQLVQANRTKTRIAPIKLQQQRCDLYKFLYNHWIPS